ncbi:hypothetical protein [Paraburkholderia sp. BCC1876]|uniref:hypothetical protein n=1 Tax=Paraburkholderia sp. BCC1876 TaxID=2676303 RepID=UPI00159008C1|nr:hypothetical protein [Paraburkholderia sp. BCC1876]
MKPTDANGSPCTITDSKGESGWIGGQRGVSCQLPERDIRARSRAEWRKKGMAIFGGNHADSAIDPTKDGSFLRTRFM